MSRTIANVCLFGMLTTGFIAGSNNPFSFKWYIIIVLSGVIGILLGKFSKKRRN